MKEQQDNTNNSFFAKAMNPYLIAGIALGGAVLFMIFGKFTNSIGATDLSERFPYVAGGSFLLLFAVYNSIFSLNAEDLNKYWMTSFLAYAGLLAGSLLFAYLFSSLWLPGTFRWIYFILSFGYLTFLSIMGFVKRVFNVVKREDERMHGKWD
jgi:hypothetical protein